MFCPVGYRSAAELWIDFLKSRLEPSYDSAVKAYNKADFLACFTRGSPLDICEHAFLRSLSAVGLHLTSPAGNIVRLHVRLVDGEPSILSVLDPHSSAWNSASASIDFENSNCETFLNDGRYKSWDYGANENEPWSDTYKGFSHGKERHKNDPYIGLQHHTLPFHFLRHSYVIAAEIPTWAIHSSQSSQITPIIENYAGWSICIDEATFAGPWQRYLTGLEQFYAEDMAVPTIGLPGRPKMTRAMTAFEAMGFDKGELSWEQVAIKIERETGEKPSHKTLRNWRASHIPRE